MAEDTSNLVAQLAEAVNRRDTDLFAAGSSPAGRELIHPDSCRQGLAEAGARRQLAAILRAEASHDLADWCQAARVVGISMSEMSRLSGASRDAIRAWLGESNGQAEG